MIKRAEAISLCEVKEILAKEDSEKAKNLLKFIKKFSKASTSKAKEIKKELEALNIFGLRQEEIVKIVDLMPEDTEDLRKILVSSELSLKQDETQKILEIIQKYRAK
ncbi:MAG: DNA-directed RNA polymerase subunit F [Candidatus Pacearchaeota archaeon]